MFSSKSFLSFVSRNSCIQMISGFSFLIYSSICLRFDFPDLGLPLISSNRATFHCITRSDDGFFCWLCGVKAWNAIKALMGFQPIAIAANGNRNHLERSTIQKISIVEVAKKRKAKPTPNKAIYQCLPGSINHAAHDNRNRAVIAKVSRTNNLLVRLRSMEAITEFTTHLHLPPAAGCLFLHRLAYGNLQH